MLSKGKVHHNCNFKFGDENIEVVRNYKYLGLSLNYYGRFRKGELDLKEQTTRALYSVIGKCKKVDVPVDMPIDLFNPTVLPILTFSCEIWAHYIVRGRTAALKLL